MLRLKERFSIPLDSCAYSVSLLKGIESDMLESSYERAFQRKRLQAETPYTKIVNE